MQPRRRQESTWLGLRPTGAVLGLLGVMAAVSLADALLGHPPALRAHLGLIPQRALGPEPWQLVTTAFVHLHLGSLLSTAITLWFFGAPVEQQLGRARFFLLFLVATVAGSVVSSGLALLAHATVLLAGAHAASIGVMAAFGGAFAGMPIALFGVQQMKASTCALVFIVIALVIQASAGDFIGLGGSIAGGIAGWTFVRADRHLLSGLGASTRAWQQRYRRWKIRRRYRVIPGGRDSIVH